MNIYYEAAIWIGMALLAAVVSVRIAVPVALVEIVIGALAGNLPGIKEHVTETDIVPTIIARQLFQPGTFGAEEEAEEEEVETLS